MPLAPLVVAVPLLAAFVLAVIGRLLHRRAIDVAGLFTSGVVVVLLTLLVADSLQRPIVYWLGGRTIVSGIPLGISLTIDPIGAGLALFSAVLMFFALVFAWHYFETVGRLFHVLMMLFLAGMVGMCLTGDIFNLFVFFELMSVSSFALTAYRVEESGPLQGGLNFAVTNTLGAVLVVSGIAFLYARTGALNLAQMGNALAGERTDGLVIVGFTLIMSGFFVKAAIVPFHFWLVDAYASAPTPVCLLLTGVMSELGLYAMARVLWTVFDPAMAGRMPELRTVLVAIGLLTALGGAVMCYAQHHLKRLLAFATVAHSGIYLIGLGFLTAGGLGAVGVYAITDGLVKASLFVCAGILLNARSSIDELNLYGQGRDLKYTAAIFGVGALALAGLAPFGTFVGKTLIEEEAKLLGMGWLTLPMVAVSVLTGGATLRAFGRVFVGLGPKPTEDLFESDPFTHLAESEDQDSPETEEAPGRAPLTMLWPAGGLLALALLAGLWPHALTGVERAAMRFTDFGYYADLVLDPASAEPPRAPPAPLHITAGLPAAVASIAGALVLAGLGLYRQLVSERLRHAGRAVGARPLAVVRALHSGHVGDYVAWLVLGVALFGGLFGWALG